MAQVATLVDWVGFALSACWSVDDVGAVRKEVKRLYRLKVISPEQLAEMAKLRDAALDRIARVDGAKLARPTSYEERMEQ